MRLPLIAVVAASVGIAAGVVRAQEQRIGIIGLDTSHSTAFTKLLNAENKEPDVQGFRVTAAYKHGSLDIESSVKRIPEYTEQMIKMGVKIVDSVTELCNEVDFIMLETNDGRRHLEQALEVYKSGKIKRMFIDKPIAASLADTIAIFDAADKYGVKIFSSSSLRYPKQVQEARAGKFGRVVAANTFSPASLEPTNPGLVWYGIHAVESLFTLMGTGCLKVVSMNTEDTDFVVGLWNDGRISSMRGHRGNASKFKGGKYGCEVFTEKNGVMQMGNYEGYKPLVVDVLEFFKGGDLPIPPAETIEIMAFIEAAEESRKSGGHPVQIADMIKQARVELAKRRAP